MKSRLHKILDTLFDQPSSAGNPDTPSSKGFTTAPYSGILGSVWGLNYTLTSYQAFSGDAIYTGVGEKPNTDNLNYLEMRNQSITNHSYGMRYKRYNQLLQDIGNNSEYMKLLTQNTDKMSTIASEPNTLYVFSAGNDEVDLDKASDFNAYRNAHVLQNGTLLSNVVIVGATNLGTDTESDVTNVGSQVKLAADGWCTSYSAPLVTGTAGLLKAIDSSLTPPELITIMKETGKDLGNGMRFLDVSAAVLDAIKTKDDDFVPMSLESAEYSYDSPGTDVEINETGTWSLDNGLLTVTRDMNAGDHVLSTEGGFIPHAESSLYDKENNGASVYATSRLMASQVFDIGMAVLDTGSDKFPELVAKASGTQDFEWFGKLNTDVESGTSSTQKHAFCMKLQYDDTPSTDEDKGYVVPLVRDASISGVPIQHDISNVTLTANMIGNFNDHDDYDDIEIPNCDDDISETYSKTLPDWGTPTNPDNPTAITYSHVSVDVDDTTCTETLSFESSTNDDDVEVDGKYYQAFDLTTTRSETPNCASDVTVTVSYVECDSSMCSNTYTYTYPDPDTGEDALTVHWDFTADGFPLKDAWDLIVEKISASSSGGIQLSEPKDMLEDVKFNTPSFGYAEGSLGLRWAHGIGPVAPVADTGTEAIWNTDSIDKLDRTVK